MSSKRKSGNGATENVRVVVRVRPLSDAEQYAGDEEVMRIGADKATIQVMLPSDEDFAGNVRQTAKNFALDGCLDQSTTQAECFNSSGVKTLLDSALEGFSATVFAYGQTGSGKTYTMAGKEMASVTTDGIIPRSVRYIFDQVTARKGQVKYTIRASFLEIYNEMVRDLWNPSSGALSIREYPPGYWRGFYVEDLYIFECTNVDDMLFMLTEGMRHRAVGSHNLNKDSSRSHSMLTFYLESEEEVDSDPYVKFGKISFVDLAGSERLKETQGNDAYGGRSDFQATFRSRARMKGDEMLKETGNINKSLFTLGKVISALGDASKSAAPHYVPYRDSKLTKLLMDSLGGSSKALMFACCSPAGSYLEESLNTLQYAARTRNIQNKPAVQVDPHEELVRELRREMKMLKTQNSQLHYALQRCAQMSNVLEIRSIITDGLDAISSQGNLQLDDVGEQVSMGDDAARDGAGGGGGRGKPAARAASPDSRGRRATGRRRAGATGAPTGNVDHSHTPPRARAAGVALNVQPRSGSGGGRRTSRTGRDGVHQVQSAVELGGGSGRGRGRGYEGHDFGDDDWRAQDDHLDGPAAGGYGWNHRRDRSGSNANDAEDLLPDSLMDPAGSSDWKEEMDFEAREHYRQLGLVLYKATSQDEMAAAMVSLQQFEREQREAAAFRRASRGQQEDQEDPDQAFRKMAMVSSRCTPAYKASSLPRHLSACTLARMIASRWLRKRPECR